MRVIHDPGMRPIKCWTDGVELEPEAEAQLRNVASLPFIHKHVAVMPDVHWGMGATVGSVIATLGAIVPAAVGVDIGCGMIAQRTSLLASDLPDNLLGLRTAIERVVPHGRSEGGGPNDRGAWSTPPDAVAKVWATILGGLKELSDEHPKARLMGANHVAHLATLGTGNHFIEICIDEEDHVWVMLHSGSRGIGNRIGSYFIERAKEHMRRWFVNLPDENLAYLPEETSDFLDYVRAIGWAQHYAAVNRQLMMAATLGAMQRELGRSGYIESASAINCHHNYVAREHHFGKNVWVTRKGAVRARGGDLGIIPGSMGAKSFIVRGKGLDESFMSCSHGAGRRMSRGQAKRTFSLEDHAAATAGVECRKDAGVIDETPGAYKSIDAVMAAQADLVDVVHTLRQVVCVKG